MRVPGATDTSATTDTSTATNTSTSTDTATDHIARQHDSARQHDRPDLWPLCVHVPLPARPSLQGLVFLDGPHHDAHRATIVVGARVAVW